MRMRIIVANCPTQQSMEYSPELPKSRVNGQGDRESVRDSLRSCVTRRNRES